MKPLNFLMGRPEQSALVLFLGPGVVHYTRQRLALKSLESLRRTSVNGLLIGNSHLIATPSITVTVPSCYTSSANYSAAKVCH